MKRAIVIPDQHFPIHDEEAVNVTLQAIEYVKPEIFINLGDVGECCLLYTSPSPRDRQKSRMPSSA